MRRSPYRTPRRRRSDTVLDGAAPLALGLAALAAVALRPAPPDPWRQVRQWAPVVAVVLTLAGSWALVTQQTKRSHADSYTLVRVAEQVAGLEEEVERVRVTLESQTQDRYTATEASRDRTAARRERLQLQSELDELTRRVAVLEDPR
ncbi:MAG: hypothetical protein AAGC60_00280 [Acidobacteriota bacterium]